MVAMRMNTERMPAKKSGRKTPGGKRAYVARIGAKPESPMRAKARELQQGRNAKAGVDWDSQPLGKVPDSVLARLHGVSVKSVCKVRNARGIAKYDSKIANQESDTAPVDCANTPDSKVVAYQNKGGRDA